MKNFIWAMALVVLAALFILEFRYTLVVNSPIVAKIDRLTGDVWVANSGMWLKVQHVAKEEPKVAVVAAPKPAEKPAQDKAK